MSCNMFDTFRALYFSLDFLPSWAENRVSGGKRLSLASLQQTCNEYIYLKINKSKLAFLLQKSSGAFWVILLIFPLALDLSYLTLSLSLSRTDSHKMRIWSTFLSWRTGEHLSWRTREHFSWRTGEHISWRTGIHLSWRTREHLSWRTSQLENRRANELENRRTYQLENQRTYQLENRRR